MKKKLLPALLGAALAGGASVVAADVTLFGHIDTSFDAVDQEGGSDDVNFSCTTCSIGFKGSEDLGNGLKAIFQLDFQYDTTTRNRVAPVTKGLSGGSGSLTDRDQWLGLAGGYGKVRVGTISTHYKSHGAMIDPFYRTAIQGRDRGLQSTFHSGAGEELQGRATNTLRYDSPNYSGFKAGFHYTLDSGSNKNIGVMSEDDNPWGIGGSYQNGAILVFADYMTNDGSATTVNGDIDAWKVGGSYTGGMFGAMAQYEDSSDDNLASGNTDITVWHVAGTVSLFGMDMYLGFGKTEEDISNDDLTSWTLAVSHNLSKRTMVYVGHSQYDCSSGGSGAALDICSSVGVIGGEDDKTSFGMKHKF